MRTNLVKRLLVPVFLAGAIATASQAPALATQVWTPAGGLWDYGVEDFVWSDYLLSYDCHTSTAIGDYTDWDSAGAGLWSEAAAPADLWGNESYYQSHC